MLRVNQWARVAAGVVFACSMAAAAPPAHALYQLITEIPVGATAANPFNTGGQLNGPFTAYDISFFDNNTQLDYVADRTNASVDIFSAATNTQVGSVGGFVGLRAGTPSMPVPVGPPPPGTPAPVNALSGPDGVVVTNTATEHQLWAGDGNSTLKVFSLTNTVPPTATPILGTPPGINTGGQFRVDEGSFDPKDNIVAFANNADTPPFLTLVNAGTGAVLTKVTFDGTNKGVPLVAGNGIEQSVWDKNTQRFYISVPQIGTSSTDPGGIAALDAAGNVTAVFDLANFGITSCSPSGLSVANNINGHGTVLGINCGNANSQVVLFDPTANAGAGGIVGKFTQFSGGDEDWFDPATGLFFFAEQNNASGPVLGIIDGNTDSFFQSVPTTPGDHSVAVDPVSGEVFVPAGQVAGNNICSNGCILVFAQAAAVPEPGSLALLGSALVGLAGLAWRRRRST